MQNIILILASGILMAILMACASMQTAHESAEETRDRVAVYTEFQANRGRGLYDKECARCHGRLLFDGTQSPLVGDYFLAKWERDDQSMFDFFKAMKATMIPKGVTLSESGWVDVLAYILKHNAYPPGNQVMTDDPVVLSRIPVTAYTSPTAIKDAVPPVFIRGEFGIFPHSASPMQWEMEEAADKTRDWLYSSHDYTGRRYGTLSGINRRNAGRLQMVGTFEIGGESGMHSEPIVYEGVMYVTSAYTTMAFDAVSGREIWRHVWEPKQQVARTGNQGVAIKGGRVIRTTADGYLLCLRIGNGSLLYSRRIADPGAGEFLTMPPLPYKNRILVGSSYWVAAYQLKNGDPVWRYETDTGSNGVGEASGRTNTALFSLDVETGELYAAVSNTLIALDVSKGTLKWFDDMHREDGIQQGPIFQTRVSGDVRPLVATTSPGLLRIRDRETRERLYDTTISSDPTERNAKSHGLGYNPETDMLYLPTGTSEGGLTAVDAATGAVRWQYRSSMPMVAAVATTAGGIVCTGELTGDFVTLDALSGEVLYRFDTGKPIDGGVVTYQVEEKQYIAVISGRPSSTVFVFTIPD